MYKKVKRRCEPYSADKYRPSLAKRVKDIFLSNKNYYHKIDYAQKKEYFFRKSQRKKISTKKKLEMLALSLFLVSFFGVVAWHPFFSIKQVDVSGLNRIDREEFTNAVFNILNCKKIFVFSGQSYIFVDVDEVRDVLFEKYSLNSISIKKVFPGTIEINLEEKISTVIYDDGQTYSFVDLAGNFVETIANVSEDEWYKENSAPIATSTEEMPAVEADKVHKPNSKRLFDETGNYPLVYDLREGKPAEGAILKPEHVKSLIEWYNIFNNELKESVSYFTLINSIGDAEIWTYDSWHANVRLGERFESQSKELKYILGEEIDGQYFDYIELRYPDRAYWR